MSIPNVVFVDEDDAELILNINNLSNPKRQIHRKAQCPHCTVKFITGSLLDISTFTFDLSRLSSHIEKEKRKEKKNEEKHEQHFHIENKNKKNVKALYCMHNC